MYHMFEGFGYGMGGGGMFMMGLFWIVIIVGSIYLIKALMGKGHDKEQTESALDILKKRYAKGEISSDEYEKIRKDLEN